MILPTLSGPHVPRFVAAGDFSMQPYIVMELLKGRRSGRGSTTRLSRRRARARRRADRRRAPRRPLQHVIHLDVKPSNVMFRETGEAVLIDFGLSRHDPLPDLLAEEFRLPMGTGPYISPEQIRHIRNDPRSDLFALGRAPLSPATGERPFGNPTSLRGLRRRLYRDPIPPRALDPDFPPWLQEVILALPGDRALAPAGHGGAARLRAPASRSRSRSAPGLNDAPRRRRGGRRAGRLRRSASRTPAVRRRSGREAPIILVAIDLASGSQALSDALRLAARRVAPDRAGRPPRLRHRAQDPSDRHRCERRGAGQHLRMGCSWSSSTGPGRWARTSARSRTTCSKLPMPAAAILDVRPFRTASTRSSSDRAGARPSADISEASPPRSSLRRCAP